MQRGKNGKNDTPIKINAILLNVKISRQKLVHMCAYKLATN